jgi:hypothetical protein
MNKTRREQQSVVTKRGKLAIREADARKFGFLEMHSIFPGIFINLLIFIEEE